MRQLILLLLLCAALPAQAVYKCRDSSGAVTYSQGPCGPDARQIDATPAAGAGTGIAPDGGAAGLNAQADAMASDRRARDLGYEIRRGEARINRIIERRDAELAAIRHAKGYANNNLAGAVYADSLSGEMQAVASRYAADVQVERDRVEALRREREALGR